MSFINSLIAKLFGSKSEKDLKAISPFVDQIKAVYPSIAQLSNDELRQASQKLKSKIKEYIAAEEEQINNLKIKMQSDQLSLREKENTYSQIDTLIKEVDTKIEEILIEILPEAFSIVKETAKRFKENPHIEVTANEFDREIAVRKKNVLIEGDKALWNKQWMAGGNLITWDMEHYDVQLFGGVVLHQGKIAEMSTGEGKTLVATLPVFLNALTGKGVHVVTVNTYLSQRDSEWMGPIYEFHGLSVDCIDKHQPNSDSRRKAYLADITFGTNNEFGFDYLRDNMVFSPDELVQRKHHYSIVDEVDSVLIDDARTPLIISGPIPKGDDQMFNEYKPFVSKLYNAQRVLATKLLTEAKRLMANGVSEEGALLLYRAHKALPKYKPTIKFLSEAGIKIQMQKTENIYMQDNNKRMHEVTDDLYFVIDEKSNSVDLMDKGLDLISETVNDNRFFVLPDVGGEISEIEKSAQTAEEKAAAKDTLLSDYAIKSERVHTVNQLLKAYAMFEIDVDYVVMDNKVKIVDEQTGRILDGRRYSDGLHQAIEAKEGVKVEAATQTFASITLQNYFRMYHKLAGMTGTAETEAGELWSIYKLDVVVIPTNRPITRIDGQDMVYRTKREKYNAIIEEIVRLSQTEKRPVLVGTTAVDMSELFSRMLKQRGIAHNVLNAKHHQREAEIVQGAGQASAVTIATNMAGRGTDIKLGTGVKEAGGLAIIGTERHESRRVDRQLRGRAGRQGDPGTSQFYLSLEDNLMRMFGSERVTSLMDRLGFDDGEPIQHSMITKSIENAQRKVEENNFGIRKRLLEYDDVMNAQRNVIYTRRRHALHGERVDTDIANMISDYCYSLADQFTDSDYDTFYTDFISIFAIEPSITAGEFGSMNKRELAEKLSEQVTATYEQKMQALADQAYPIIKDVQETKGELYENILVPISDGIKILNTAVNLKKAYETQASNLGESFSKTVMLLMIDEHWKEHLREMDDLKQSVQNASYEQKDPLLIYKGESFQLFQLMLDKIAHDVLGMLIRAHIPLMNKEANVRKSEPTKTDLSKLRAQKEDVYSEGDSEGEAEKKIVRTPVRVEKVVGRNDPCFCGSGKKYKNCHGANE